MPESLINLFVQVPLVALFMWFIFERDKRSYENEEKRDKKLTEDLAQRDGEWRTFLAEQRTQKHEDSLALATDLKELARQIAAMNAVILTHDARTQKVMDGHLARAQKEK